MNENDFSDTIAPKSNQLNCDDLLTGPITVKIMNVSRGETKEQPVLLHIDGERMPFLPCKSMRRVLIAAWGAKGSQWVGKRLTLFADMSVSFGGSKVGGIRISHLSDITEPLKMMLTSTRSKRSEYTVLPLPADTAKNTQADTARKSTVARLWKITANIHGGNKETLQQWLMDEGYLSVEPIEELSEVSADRLAEVLSAVEKKLKV